MRFCSICVFIYEINKTLTLGAFTPRQLHHELQVVASKSILWHGLGHLLQTAYKGSRSVYLIMATAISVASTAWQYYFITDHMVLILFRRLEEPVIKAWLHLLLNMKTSDSIRTQLPQCCSRPGVFCAVVEQVAPWWPVKTLQVIPDLALTLTL